jgi:flagellar hook assembly protein FlgD
MGTVRRAAIAAVCCGLFLASSAAAGASTATIVSPESGSHVLVGFTGPISLSFDNDLTPGTFTLTVTGPSYIISQPVTVNEPGTVDVTIPSADNPGAYTIELDEGATAIATDDFTVDPVVQVSATSASPSIFLPYERDGVRDSTTGQFTLNTQANATVRVRNHVGRVVRRKALGTLTAGTHSWKWAGRNDSGHLVRPGRFTITFSARANGITAAGHSRAVRTQIGLHLTKSSVSPINFYPIKRDGFRDATIFSFTTNRRSNDLLEVKNSSGRVIRHHSLGFKRAGRHHVSWRGTNDSGGNVPAGTYRIRVVAKTVFQTKNSHWLKVVIRKGPSSGGTGDPPPPNCTQGYSPCLVYHGGADYDCAGGSGNGPYYTKPGVVYHVTGSDPYGLDADHDGLGCE